MRNHLREIIEQNHERRMLFERVPNAEEIIKKASTKVGQLALKRYIESLASVDLASYKTVVKEMTECTICLTEFEPQDEIIVFACDEKHYFHKKCGSEWLEVKTDCPLCRVDFSKEINEFINDKSEEIMRGVVREVVQNAQG